MTYPRVNFLHRSERRFQGAVSRRFILASAIITPLSIIGALWCFQLIQYTGLRSNLKTSQEIWANLQPRMTLHKEELNGLKVNRQTLSLLEGWNDSQVPFKDLLEDIQMRVPENIQFTRLSIRSPISTAIFSKPEELSLNYGLNISGLASGARAENEVIAFRKALLGSKKVESVFNSVRLASMRKRQGEGDENIREFKLEGFNPEGGDK